MHLIFCYSAIFIIALPIIVSNIRTIFGGIDNPKFGALGWRSIVLFRSQWCMESARAIDCCEKNLCLDRVFCFMQFTWRFVRMLCIIEDAIVPTRTFLSLDFSELSFLWPNKCPSTNEVSSGGNSSLPSTIETLKSSDFDGLSLKLASTQQFLPRLTDNFVLNILVQMPLYLSSLFFVIDLAGTTFLKQPHPISHTHVW